MTATGCMMRACLALCVAAALVGAARAHCDGCLDGECYRKHRLPVYTYSWFLDINRNTNTFYVNPYNSDTNIQCQLDTVLCNNMTNTQKIYRMTIDQRTGDTYGKLLDQEEYNLYKLDLVNNENKLLVRGVHHITFKDKIYYSIYGRGIYTYEDGVSRLVAGSEGYDVDNFVVDTNDDIYFRGDSDSDSVRRLSKGIVDPTEQWDGPHFSVDRDGNAVLFNRESRAVYRITNGQATEVGAIQDWLYYDSPKFDRDNNIIYKSKPSQYYLLKREKGVHCTVSILENKRIITETVANTETTDDLTSTTPTYTIEETTSGPSDGTTE